MSEERSIKQLRESLGISRQDLAAEAGVTVSAIASVERGGNSRDKGAEEKIRFVLSLKIAPPARDDKDAPRVLTTKANGVPPTRVGWTYTEEWSGMKPGHRFTVTGEEGVFTFLRHTRNAKGSEWVDCIGNEPNYPPKFRAFACERVHPY